MATPVGVRTSAASNCERSRSVLVALPAIAFLLAVTGCASVAVMNPRAVEGLVAPRSGGLSPAWPLTSKEKAEVDAAISVLLAAELTPETAVQIALLNNRHLRATFEDIGVSHAEVMAAARWPNPILGATVRWPQHAPRPPNIELSLVGEFLEVLLIPIRKRIAEDELTQTEQRVAHEVLGLAAEVKAAAYTVQAREHLRERMRAIVEVNHTGADLGQRQYDAGNISRLELANIRIAAFQAELELVRVEGQLRADREKMNRLLGLAAAPHGLEAGARASGASGT
jgi:outer membrane protein, heavy metal efflux system